MALLITTAVMVAVGSMATASGATVFYTACDGLTASDTVKVKKIEEDGSGAATVADTTINHCGSGTPSRYITGLAIHDGFAYFSWIAADFSSTGIGRVGLNGGGLALDHIAGPSGAQWLRLNPTVVGGNLYLYADNGSVSGSGSNATDPRIVRVGASGGSFSTIYRPYPNGSGVLSFGVTSTHVYAATGLTTLMRTALDANDKIADPTFFALPSGPQMLLTGNVLAAGSDSALFLYTMDPGAGSAIGASTLGLPPSGSNFTLLGTVPGGVPL